MYEVRVSNGNNDVFFISEEEKLRVLRNRLEAERKAKRKSHAFFTKETAIQKVIAVVLTLVSLMVSISTGENVLVIVLFICIPMFLAKRNVFGGADEWEDN